MTIDTVFWVRCQKNGIMEIMEEMTRQRVDWVRLPGFAKALSRHFCVKVADTLSLETEGLVSVNRALQIADYRLVINATQFLRTLFKRPPRSYNPVRLVRWLLKGVIVPLSSRINGAFIVLKWCPFSCIKGAVTVVKWCLTATKTLLEMTENYNRVSMHGYVYHAFAMKFMH